MSRPILFLKANVRGHVKKNGTYVSPYQTKAPAAKPASVVKHPKQSHEGKDVLIHHPTKPSPKAAWSDPDAVATFVPGGDMPAELNGIPFASWGDHPRSLHEWADVPGQLELDEPELEEKPGKHVSAGVVVEEADGRVWLVAPTNAFGGYKATFPKGTQDDGLSLQATAIKEAFEESGLKVEITGFVGDVERTTSIGRYYLARRVGGTPADMGWESQAAHLVPRERLYDLLNRNTDHGIAESVGAGPAPVAQPADKLF